MNVRTALALFLLASTCIWACKCGKGKDIPDVSHISMNANIQRFDQQLMSLDTLQLDTALQQLRREYPVFYPLYAGDIIADGSNPETDEDQFVKAFVRAPVIRALYDTCQARFTQLGSLEQDLNHMLQFYKYYFPDKVTPEVVAYFSEFSIGTFAYGDSLLGIGLDFYLGPAYRYDIEVFPLFIQRNMTPEYIVPKAAEALATNLLEDLPGNRLLDIMIQNGKILYIKDLLLPYEPDSVKWEYTAAQTNWVQNNEAELWAHITSKNLLYETKRQVIQKLVSPSPNGPPDVPPEAPGRAANWLGLQIVEAYMRRNPQVTVHQLIAEKDAQEILTRSKYKPRR